MSPAEPSRLLATAGQFEADLCVVIVNYRTPSMVIDCLETVVPQARKLSGWIVVVDNASLDDSVPRLETWITEAGANELIDVVVSQENVGFAAGNNIGIERCAAKYYLLLNSDTLVEEGALERLVRGMQQQGTVGLLSPRLEWHRLEKEVVDDEHFIG